MHGGVALGELSADATVTRWFVRRRGRALAVATMGLSAAGIVIPMPLASAITHLGWRGAWVVIAVTVALLGAAAALAMRTRPEDHGLVADGGTAISGESPSERSLTARQAFRTPAFWLLSLGHGFALFVVTAVNVHAITHMKEGLGYPVETAALYIMLMTVAQVGGIAIGALTGDRFDKRLICAGCMLMHMAGLLCLTYAGGPAMIVAFAVLHGVAWGLRGPFMQAIRADYFGVSAIGMILGLSFMIIVVGQIGGPLIAGTMSDLTGNYRAGFTVLALLAGVGSLFFLLARKPARPRHEGR